MTSVRKKYKRQMKIVGCIFCGLFDILGRNQLRKNMTDYAKNLVRKSANVNVCIPSGGSGLRAAVYIEEEMASVRVANSISRYLYRHHPEYYARIINSSDYKEFCTSPGNFGMDLYVLEVKRCDNDDLGLKIAKRLRDGKVNCAMAFVVPCEITAVEVTRMMLRPSYIFINEAKPEEIDAFMADFLVRMDQVAFMEFTYKYKKWLVNIENIRYVQTNAGSLLLVCKNATLESTERLTDIELRLPGHFVRVDKGCLINTKLLVSVDFSEKKAMFGSSDFVYMSRRGARKLYDTLYGE